MAAFAVVAAGYKHSDKHNYYRYVVAAAADKQTNYCCTVDYMEQANYNHSLAYKA